MTIQVVALKRMHCLSIRYYASFAPVLKAVLVNPKVDSMTRGRTLECLTLIGEAVGKDMFLSDARALMDLMVRLNAKEDAMLQSYIWAAWNRICVALGPQEFERYVVERRNSYPWHN